MPKFKKDSRGFRMKGSTFYGKSPLKQENKLFEGEHPDTFIYEGDNKQQKLINYEDRVGSLKEDEWNQGSLTDVQQTAMDSLQNRLANLRTPKTKSEKKPKKKGE